MTGTLIIFARSQCGPPLDYENSCVKPASDWRYGRVNRQQLCYGVVKKNWCLPTAWLIRDAAFYERLKWKAVIGKQKAAAACSAEQTSMHSAANDGFPPRQN
jgi:hypothetical protein